MTRDEIKPLMLSSGFTFVKTTKSYPGRRGNEDIYTREPEYRYTFRVSLVDENSDDYGLYVGYGDQFEQIDKMVEHDIDVAEIWNSNHPLPMWSGNNLQELLSYFRSSVVKRNWDEKDDEELITVILPTINNG
ncbi:MAG: hypothetical protein WAQ22_03665 [Candidatus Saccharimonas sp.]